MKYGCPNSKCNFHQKTRYVVKNGSYKRKDDSRVIPRYRCQCCGLSFSSATFNLAYKHKKRRVNNQLFKLLSSGVSMRRSAIILNINRTTVKRKLEFLANKSRLSTKKFLEKIRGSVHHLQFDDLITIEHTKLKPLSVTVAVDKKRRFILGAKVSQIPSFGHLAAISRKKYGKRKSYHIKGMNELFAEIQGTAAKDLIVETDEHKNYPNIINKYFPESTHQTFKGERSRVAGQGELKRIYYDPLFTINHTCAMLRANINRLFRRTWCTSKCPKMLQNHLDIFIEYYNQKLLIN